MYGFEGNPFGGFQGQFAPLAGDGDTTQPRRTRNSQAFSIPIAPRALSEFSGELEDAGYSGGKGSAKFRVPFSPTPAPIGIHASTPAQRGEGGGGFNVPFSPAPPQRDAGGLDPQQRQNFLRSVAGKNAQARDREQSYAQAKAAGVDDRQARVGAAAAGNTAMSNAMTPPWMLNTEMARSADSRLNNESLANVTLGEAYAGQANANTNRTNALTPSLAEGMAITNRANQQAVTQNAQAFPLTLDGFKAQAQQRQAQADAATAQVPYAGPMAQAQVGAVQAGTDQYKNLQQQHTQALGRIKALEGELARYQNAKQGSGDAGLSAADNAVLGKKSGAAAQTQQHNLNAPATPGPATQTMPMTPNTAQGGQQAQQMGQGGGKPITRDLLRQFLAQAQNDPEKGKMLARQAGYDPGMVQ